MPESNWLSVNPDHKFIDLSTYGLFTRCQIFNVTHQRHVGSTSYFSKSDILIQNLEKVSTHLHQIWRDHLILPDGPCTCTPLLKVRKPLQTAGSMLIHFTYANQWLVLPYGNLPATAGEAGSLPPSTGGGAPITVESEKRFQTNILQNKSQSQIYFCLTSGILTFIMKATQ